MTNYMPAKPRLPLLWHELVKLVHGLHVESLVAYGDGREVHLVDGQGGGLDRRHHWLIS